MRPRWRGRRIFWLTDSTNSCKAVRTVYFFWALECSLKRDKDGCAHWLPVNGSLWGNLDDWMCVCVKATDDFETSRWNKILHFMSSWMPTTILSTERQRSSKAVFELKIKKVCSILKRTLKPIPACFGLRLNNATLNQRAHWNISCH